MSAMAGILGWKDILRPIRDGFRHVFPAPDTGPTPEERRKRRDQDRLKGFTYFDTFEQLEAWSTQESYPLQRANTPLLPRCVNSNLEEQRANVLLCHDYGGNYHDYESVQEIVLNDEMYACEYFQYVETFVYFSHKLVCVPPPTWTNALHRNGVKSLGTILLEPQTKETERLLQHVGEGDSMVFKLARQLADIAKHYCFDGWLVNIEKAFPIASWSPEILRSFLAQLRQELGDDMQLVWYDALTTSNEISYQNSLSVMNLTFAEACGGILTNYCWSESQANASKSIAAQSCLAPSNVYFGIDVWAQNNTGITHPRTTYPKRGGGGTNTGVAVAKLADLGLSAGIFAPAWSFEHFPGHGREVEQAVWEGEALPSNIECSCGNAGSRHQPTGSSIFKHAKLSPAGSETFFHTDFTRTFGRLVDKERSGQSRNNALHAQLGAQSPLPLPLPFTDLNKRSRISHRLEEDFSRSKLVIEFHNYPTPGNSDNQGLNCWIPLYKVNMPADGSLRLTMTCCSLITTGGLVPSLYLKLVSHEDESTHLLSIDATGDVCTVDTIVGVQHVNKNVRLGELGFHLGGSHGEGITPILEIDSISIVPIGYLVTPCERTIHKIRVGNRGEGENTHIRVWWDYVDAQPLTQGVPHSELTGPFSYFIIKLDGMRVGRAYALEHIVPEDLLETLGDKEVAVEITGVGFDGSTLACATTTLRMCIE